MLLQQYYLGCLAHASYLIADEMTGTAVVVDPQRDIDQYLTDAEAHGWHIRFVFLTHFHADFLAGHLELHERTGAAICLGAQAQADYAFTPFRDGEMLTFGQVRLTVLETPSHTPEAISILVYDLAQNAHQPYAVLTGDTLFIGDVGRPDLMASCGFSATELAGMLYDSLHHKLLPLPNEILVYPAHGAGSLCGKNLSRDLFSSLGVQRRTNAALQPMSKAAFVTLVSANQPEMPPYFAYAAERNRRQRPTLAKILARTLTPLTLEHLVHLMHAGAQIVDARQPAMYAARHLTGSINIGLHGQYALWAGTVLDRQHPIVIIAEAGREHEATLRLGRIGFDHIAGYVAGGIHALAARLELTRCTERLSPLGLAAALASAAPPLLLDVRTPQERRAKYIAGSLHIPLQHLQHQLHEVPRGRKIIVDCASGYRSSLAVGLLERYEHDTLADIDGGVTAWEDAELATLGPIE